MRVKVFYAVLLVCVTLLAACKEDDYSQTVGLSINDGTEFLSLDYQSHTGELNVESILAWQVSTDAEWITLSSSTGSAGKTKTTINIDENQNEARFAILKFSDNIKTVDFVVSQSAKDTDFDSPTHYFYVTFGTLPTLYAGLFMLATKKPSYMFFERSKTFNPAYFPSYTTNAPYYAEDQAKMRDYMKAKILEVNRDNPTAVYGLMIDDLRSRLSYDWFVDQGIDSSRVKVTLLSDGTYTYNSFRVNFGDNATAENNWKGYAELIDDLNWDHNGQYPATLALPEFDSENWAYYMSTLPNYRLLLQYGSLLETNSQYIKDQITKMNMISITPEKLLNQLSRQDQYRFYDMASFDYSKFEAMFNDSNKPNLIIIGTNGEAENQRMYTEKIYKQYNTTHDIFFKPHPADTSSDDYQTTFPDLKLLPGQMPFEIFVWSLLDQIDIIGGFQSTVFITVPVEKVKFIFAPNAQSLISPLNLLFQDANIEWVQ